MKNYKRIISIGAHSLDAELIGGPLTIKYGKLGAHCTMVHVTQGRLEKASATKDENDAYLKEVKEQNGKAANAMNADCKSYGFISSKMPSDKEFIKELVKYFINEKADLILTHFSGTLHPRHYYTFYTVTEAVKICRKQGYKIDLLYGENCEDLVGFVPQAYYRMLDEEVKIWFNGLKEYEIFNGGMNDVPYEQYYSTMGKVRGIESGSTYFTKAYMYASLIEYEI